MAKRKKEIVWVMGDGCAICGYQKCKEALELHHIDPTEKDFSISQNKTLAWEKVVPELQKCILVCANCHREIHYLQNFSDLKSSFIEERAKIVSKENSHTACVDCGAKIRYNAERCSACESLHRRKVERPGREELKDMIRNFPFTTIAKQYCVSDNAIRKWCKAENLPHTKKEINSISDDVWLSL